MNNERDQLLTMEQFNDFVSQNDKLKKEIRLLQIEKEKLTNDYNNLTREELALNQAISVGWTDKASAIGIASGSMMSLISGSQVWLGILGSIGTALTIIGRLIDINKKKQDAENKKTIIGTLWTAVKSAFQTNFLLGAMVAALLVGGAIAGIAALASKNTSGKKETKEIFTESMEKIRKILR